MQTDRLISFPVLLGYFELVAGIECILCFQMLKVVLELLLKKCSELFQGCAKFSPIKWSFVELQENALT
jgi:hypothetical protein